MCEILVQINSNGINMHNFRSSMKMQVHRGPDEQNILWKSNKGKIRLEKGMSNQLDSELGVTLAIGL